MLGLYVPCQYLALLRVSSSAVTSDASSILSPVGEQKSTQIDRGGVGEDVDHCIRLRRDMHAPLVSVPAARVSHPFWPRPLKQVAGWSSGDVRCLDTLPTTGLRAAPNWAEFCFATMLFAWILPWSL